MEEEIEETIKLAKAINPNFDIISTQQQFEFIKKRINADIIKEELEWYYDSKFGCPYDSLTLIHKVNANTNQFKCIR